MPSSACIKQTAGGKPDGTSPPRFLSWAPAVDARSPFGTGDHSSCRQKESEKPQLHMHAARFFFNDPATPEISPLPLHDALPISSSITKPAPRGATNRRGSGQFAL